MLRLLGLRTNFTSYESSRDSGLELRISRLLQPLLPPVLLLLLLQYSSVTPLVSSQDLLRVLAPLADIFSWCVGQNDTF